MASSSSHSRGCTSLLWGFLIFLLSSSALYAQSSNWKKAQRALSEYNDYEGAIELYKKDLSKKPNAESTFGLASCYRDLNNPAEAELYYRKALEFTNCDPIAHLYLAEALLNKGEYDEAREHLLVYKDSPHASPYAVQKLLAICDTGYYWTQEATPGYLKNEASLNSSRDDWGTAPYHDGIVFYTKNSAVELASPYEVDDRQFLRIATAKFNGEDGFTDIQALNRPINGNFHAGPATFFKDDSYIVFVRTIANPDLPQGSRVTAKNNPGIFMSERMRDGSYGEVMPLPFNEIIQYGTGAPYLSTNDQVLYFASNRPGGFGGYDIYYSIRKPDFTWEDPVNCGSTINTAGDELFPVAGSDGNFYYSTNGLPGMGGLDIFVTRGTQTSWQTPVNMRYPVNSGADDYYPMILSRDKLMLSSNRAGGSGGSDIYSFTYDRTLAPGHRILRPEPTLVAEQQPVEEEAAPAATDKPDPRIPEYDEPYPTINTSKPSQAFVPEATPAVDQSNIPGVEPQPKQKEVKPEKPSVTQEEPAVKLEHEEISMEEKPAAASSAQEEDEDVEEAPKEEQKQVKEKEEVQKSAAAPATAPAASSAPVVAPVPVPAAVPQPQSAEKQEWFVLNIETLDKGSRAALANTQVRLVDEGTGQSVRFRTDAKGKLAVEIMVGVPYTLSASRPTYGNASINFTIANASKKIIARLGLEPLFVNRDVRIPNLYFDVNAWAVKESAEVELDKLVEIMNNNPRLLVEIKSYANDKVKATDNVELSHRRARAIYNYLAYKGVEEDRITARGHGVFKPADGTEQRYRVTYRLYQEGSTATARRQVSTPPIKKAATPSKKTRRASTSTKKAVPILVRRSAPTPAPQKRKSYTGKDDPEKRNAPAPAEFSIQSL